MEKRILSFIIMAMIIAAAIAHTTKADDDEREERYEHDDEYEEDDDDWRYWDLTEDFIIPDIEPTEPMPPQQAKVRGNGGNQPANSSIDEAALLQPYLDDDRDSIPNKDDKHQGKDDLAMEDSDADGFNDRIDLYPGRDDRSFLDEDHDGITDDQDSDPGAPTDQDRDGIDDADDTHDDRPMLTRIFTWLGIMR